MIVALVTREQIFTITLPPKASGQYWINDKDNNGDVRQVAAVEGIQGEWILHASSMLALLDEEGKETSLIALRETTQVIDAYYRKDNVKVRILCEPISEDRRTFKKYQVGNECHLEIGRAEDNHILFSNKFVSAHHASLVWQDNQWSLKDRQSSNGTFLNERRVTSAELNPGDVVYIMGMKIIVGKGFFAINNPDGLVSVTDRLITGLPVQEDTSSKVTYSEDITPEYFYRSPRIYRTVSKAEIRVDQPPAPIKIEKIPLIMLLGPAITMAMTAIVMAVVAAINIISGTATIVSSLPTIIMSVSMLCGTLLWPMLTKRNEKKRKTEEESNRVAKYREYLESVKKELHATEELQRSILFENAPDVEECAERIFNQSSNLWERSFDHEDFLQFRLGIGTLPLMADIKFPEKKFSLEDDILQNEVHNLANIPKDIDNAPITFSLLKSRIVGLVGSKTDTTALLKSLLIQLVSLHSYDEVKIIFISNKTQMQEWSFVRMLPHVWNDSGNFRYLATNTDEVKMVSQQIDRIIAERSEQRFNSTTGAYLPYYVIVATDESLADGAEIFAKVFSSPEGAGFSCITIASQLVALPKECSMVIEVNGERPRIYDKNDHSGAKTSFQVEGAQNIDMSRAAWLLANLVLESDGNKFDLPDMMTFLEMYGVGKTEHLNALSRWNENSPINTLQAPVGIGQDGKLFYLDLHEKAHGPHGLIAGMTGSGKSEFIITFILSLAVNYHPDEVSFILIDYKGGGLAGAFSDELSGIKLPHLAGTITNLDGPAVNRALISIQSELRRRQAIFNEARQSSGEGTIDIYKYQKMYRSGLVNEPVPHLFIVSDEFAELKAQQPEVMAQLISAARIGRSLGVHLILATQKPTGVVDDQIWSNSRFRVCLKVQERSDSVEMLKRPDAAELKETGRFYLQVGFNELFNLGQSAWCGAPYIPSDKTEEKQNNSISVINNLGQVLIEAKTQSAGGKAAVSSQVVSIVRYLSTLADEENISSRQLWLPPIPKFIYLKDLEGKYSPQFSPYELEPVIGEYDDPFNQSQGLLRIPITRGGNTLVYGVTGGGKTTFLNTVLVGLLRHYTANQLNIYILDLGEENLRVFSEAPQVGDVLYSSDTEKIHNLFKLLQSEMVYRKKLFSNGGDNCRCGDTIPHILVILRNYAAFAEQFEQLDERLSQITREGSKYGIHFLITANAANTVRYRIAQNFANVYALQLNDSSDYIGLFGSTGGVYPSKFKGRGIFKTENTYEFQTAHFDRDYSQQAIRDFVGAISNKSGAHARPVPSLPEEVTPSFFKQSISASAVPVGIEKDSLNICYLNVEQSIISVITAQNADDMSKMARGITEQLTRMDGNVVVLDGARILNEPQNTAYSVINDNFAGAVESLFQEMVRRNNTYKTALAEGTSFEQYVPKYYLITGLSVIFNSLDTSDKDKLSTLLEKAELAYNIRFVLCDSAKTLAGFTSDAWYKRHVSGSDGLWLGDGITEQYTLKVNKITTALYAELPPYFGYVVKRGKPTLVKFIIGENCKEED